MVVEIQDLALQPSAVPPTRQASTKTILSAAKTNLSLGIINPGLSCLTAQICDLQFMLLTVLDEMCSALTEFKRHILPDRDQDWSRIRYSSHFTANKSFPIDFAIPV